MHSDTSYKCFGWNVPISCSLDGDTLARTLLKFYACPSTSLYVHWFRVWTSLTCRLLRRMLMTCADGGGSTPTSGSGFRPGHYMRSLIALTGEGDSHRDCDLRLLHPLRRRTKPYDGVSWSISIRRLSDSVAWPRRSQLVRTGSRSEPLRWVKFRASSRSMMRAWCVASWTVSLPSLILVDLGDLFWCPAEFLMGHRQNLSPEGHRSTNVSGSFSDAAAEERGDV